MMISGRLGGSVLHLFEALLRQVVCKRKEKMLATGHGPDGWRLARGSGSCPALLSSGIAVRAVDPMVTIRRH
jgi:hypothetical protein